MMACVCLSLKETEKIKHQICKIFKVNKLGITIEANMKSVDFLDVNFNLFNDTFSLFMKPNHTPSNVNINSNHPSCITKNIPLAVNKRLSEISSNERIFTKAATPYQEYEKPKIHGNRNINRRKRNCI